MGCLHETFTAPGVFYSADLLNNAFKANKKLSTQYHILPVFRLQHGSAFISICKSFKAMACDLVKLSANLLCGFVLICGP